MAWFDRFFKWIPRPFQYLKRKLDIEAEWEELKVNLKPHRYKLIFLGLLVTYPVYNRPLKKVTNQISNSVQVYIHKTLQPTEPAFQIGQNLIKHLIDHVLNDPQIKDQSMTFLFGILRDENFLTQLLEILVSALRNQTFMTELKSSVKELVIEELNDEEVKSNLVKFSKDIIQNENVKQAFIKLIENVFSSQESIETMINLLKKGVANEEVKSALASSVNFAVRQVLADEETLNQLRIFIFFLLRKFESDHEIKSMMDILLATQLGLVKRKKDPNLEKILKPQKKTDTL